MLQGDVKVRGDRVIGTWFATRQSTLADTVPNTYDCGYWRYAAPRSPSADPRAGDTLFRFDLAHTPSKGAMVLAAAVLTEAAKRGLQREHY